MYELDTTPIEAGMHVDILPKFKMEFLSSLFGSKGKFQAKHYDSKGNLLGIYDIPNGITTAGKNVALDILFRNQTQVAQWYAGFIDSSGFTAVNDATDTMASHAGWNEFTTYSEANRVSWTTAAAASGQISNTSTMNFNITGTGTLKGIFITSNNTKSGTTGTLWATALFASPVPVSNGDLIKITYTVTT